MRQNDFLRAALNRTIEKCENFEVFNGNIYVITESAKKPTIFVLLFLIAINSVKNGNKHLSEIRIKHQNSHLTLNVVVPGLRPILMTGLKCWPSVKRFADKLLFIKIKVSQNQSNQFIFQEAAVYKRQGYVLMHTPRIIGSSELDTNYNRWWCQCCSTLLNNFSTTCAYVSILR